MDGIEVFRLGLQVGHFRLCGIAHVPHPIAREVCDFARIFVAGIDVEEVFKSRHGFPPGRKAYVGYIPGRESRG